MELSARAAVPCPACHGEVPPDSLFCGRCGRQLAYDVEHPAGEIAGRGEYRHLTVMFCDLVESTALGERLDPEDLRDVVASYHDVCGRVVEQFKGHVAQYLGDGVLVYFSYPQAHEDDAERAVRAALGILAELERINPQLERDQGTRLAVRIAIHTGTVVVGVLGGGHQREALALGHSVNVAARLQRVADPDSVAVSAETLRLVRGLFITRDLGLQALPGIATPVSTHRVLQASGVRSRLDVAVAEGLTPLVGREHDLAVLLDHWDHACDGHGRVVLLSGEPGIGKSRLVYALREALADERHTWLECRGSPYHENSALHPVIGLLRQGLRLPEDGSPEQQAERLEHGLAQAGLTAPEVVPLFGALLSLPPRQGDTPPAGSPEAQRSRTLDALVEWLLSLARLQPTVLVVEDLHWTDPSTLELFGLLIERVAAAPILLVATHRPSFAPPWADRHNLSQAVVEPLTLRQTATMVKGVRGGSTLPPAVLDQLVRRTDGVPLFIEEMTKSVLESAELSGAEEQGDIARPPNELAIPSTLQDSLAARLDRLGTAKEVAQLAAVQGRDFSYELIAAVSTTRDAELDAGLATLASAGLVYQWGEPPGALYMFKHALIQEAAYGSLLHSTRRALHGRIAHVLEERFPQRAAAEPQVIARHCAEAELTDQAIDYYRRAGELATERSASAEAIAHLTRGLELLRRLPEGPERDEKELMLQVSLGAPLVNAHGWGSVEAERAYGRARELCHERDDAPELFRMIRGLVTFYAARCELETAYELCGRLMRLAESAGDDDDLVVAYQQTGIVLYFMGQPASALEHYEKALALYDEDEHAALTARYGEHYGVLIRIWMAWALWVLGHPDRARDTAAEAVELGISTSHAFSLAYAYVWGSVVHAQRREPARVLEMAEQAIAIAREEGFSFVEGSGVLLRGRGRFDPEGRPDDVDDAIEEYKRGLALNASSGTTVTGPQGLGSLAEMLLLVARPEESLSVLEGALGLSESTKQPFWDAELQRIRGELALQGYGASVDEAEEIFRHALDVARRQQARSLELRICVSLARLLQGRGEKDQARALLAPVHGWFTEGLETEDLQRAKALLDELS